MNKFEKFFRENPEIDAFLVLEKENVFYLTGFRGSFGYLLVLNPSFAKASEDRDESFLITDSRYAEVAENLNPLSLLSGGIKPKFILFDKNFEEKIKEILKQVQNNKSWALAMENSASLAQKDYWQKIFPQAKIIATDKIIENWRAIKNANELQKIRQACLRLDKVFADKEFFRGILREGVTEKEVAFELEMKLRDHGKYKLSFPVIVAFGENSAIPHHKPSDRQLKSRCAPQGGGENILIDCGVKFENYCSDMTRNFFLGEPSKEYLEAFETLLAVQKKTAKNFQIGKKLLDAEAFCRKELGNFAGFFTHSLGHGVGLDIHELPNFSPKEQAVFTAGQVVTCEPGLYFPRKFGIRIEDQILITKDGPEILTKTPKELMIL